MKIKVKKISEAALPRYRTANWDEYKCGEDNGEVSLPIEYELTGEPIEKPEEGKSFTVKRDTRNGVACLGFFMTSKIKNIREENGVKFLETENSVYSVEEV